VILTKFVWCADSDLLYISNLRPFYLASHTHYSHNANRAVRNIALLHNTPLRGALGVDHVLTKLFLFGSARLHANNPLKNVSPEILLICKKAAPLHFIQATPHLVLSALIGNFVKKVACFSRIVSHSIAKSHVKPWSMKEHDTT